MGSQFSVERNALLSGGRSASHLYELATDGLKDAITPAHRILDVGCGIGTFGEFLRRTYKGRLDGVDVVKHSGFRDEYYDGFFKSDLNCEAPWANSAEYDLVFALEIIEHLENPRAFCRQAVRVLRVGGLFVITTPNPTSLCSLTSLIIKGAFRDFRDGVGMYPTHITPVLPLDARRILLECGLQVNEITYSQWGRIPFVSRTYQSLLPFLKGGLFSDNYRIVGTAQSESK